LPISKVGSGQKKNIFGLFLPKFCLFVHNFRTRNARKPIKDLKDSDYSLVTTKNLSQKFPTVIGAQGQVTWAKMA